MNMTNKTLLAVGSALLTLVVSGEAGHSPVSAQSTIPKQFMAGVLRTDGTLVPFAEYRLGVWWNPWPEFNPNPGSEEVSPKSLGGHPEPWFRQCEKSAATWYFWPAGDSPLALKTSEVLQVVNHSQNNWALMTDYPHKKAGEKNSHHFHAGLALSVDLKVDPMVEIDKGGAEASSILADVKLAFGHSEAAEIKKLAAARGAVALQAAREFPPSAEQRARNGLIVTKLFRDSSGVDGGHIYYFDVEKRYEKPVGSRDRACENVAYLKGWVWKAKDGTLNMLGDTFGLTDCDGKERGSGVEMFGVLTLGGRTFVLAVEHGWEDEAYTVYELKEFTLVRMLETFGG